MFKAHIAALSLCFVAMPAAAGWPEDHLDVADEIVADILPANNEYGSPSTIYYENGVVHVFAECGGFVNELLKATYDPIDDALMSALFDDDPDDGKPWSSPDSTHWYRAIREERAASVGGSTYALEWVRSADEIEAGDILVSEYFEAGKTGHTMLVRRIGASPKLVTSKIPGLAAVLRYSVQVIDSTASVHMDLPGTTDTRYRRELGLTTGTLVNDRGAGRGDIHLYADPKTGALVGWSWAINQSVPYQGLDVTPALNVGKYRPIVAGRIVGPGL